MNSGRDDTVERDLLMYIRTSKLGHLHYQDSPILGPCSDSHFDGFPNLRCRTMQVLQHARENPWAVKVYSRGAALIVLLSGHMDMAEIICRHLLADAANQIDGISGQWPRAFQLLLGFHRLERAWSPESPPA